MCPSCQEHLFPKKRQGNGHISPRFDACNRWRVALDDKVVSNVFESVAGDSGHVWYMNEEKCKCGSGFPDMGLAAGSVELYHEQHPSKVEFDDGSSVVIQCPEMHLGPYHIHKPPVPAYEEAQALVDSLMSKAAMLQAAIDAERAKENDG